MTARDTVTRLDDAVDRALGHIRGPVADRIAASASRFGEFSVGWHATSLMLAAAHRRPKDAVRTSVLLVAEALIVNQGVKSMFRRTRPTADDPDRLGVRRPITSSFPSGHASAAFFAASLLTARERRLAPVWFGAAAVVATSRPYVRLHHASDVVAGAATGLALAAIARRLWPAPE